MTIGAETFFGRIETTRDALLIFEATRQGILKRVKKRISHEQKGMIRHGSVFVFDEKESKMKRWYLIYLFTQGPTLGCGPQVDGNFLIYREAEDKVPKPKTYKKSDRKVVFKEGRKEVTGSKGTYAIKPDGLVKRTLSVQVNGVTLHLVSYTDPFLPPLLTPRDTPTLNGIQIGGDLLCGQGFKRALDQNGDEFSSEADENDSRDRTLSVSSSMELHSIFDPIWNHNDEIVNEIKLFESSIKSEFEIIKSDLSMKVIPPENTCGDFLDIEEFTRDLLNDVTNEDATMNCLPSLDLNFDEYLLLENNPSWK